MEGGVSGLCPGTQASCSLCAVPGSRLYRVRELAPEFYDSLPCHKSWLKVFTEFISRPDVGPYARVKRKAAAEAASRVGGVD